MKKHLSNGSLKKSNVARGNRTSPVQTSCPAGLLAVSQQDDKNKFYKGFYDCNP
ncbi:hypothetical protein EZS27_014219 [termite gut metagenome]|uniref:Uncharacterized protein n=1 Tax=termite gut metagenome TaxID=433724 RepID=A0A5J4RUM5_9ZZZZ